MNPDTTIYEEPSSLRIEDWGAFADTMREEAARFPNSQNVLDTLRFAERVLKELREDPLVERPKEAA